MPEQMRPQEEAGKELDIVIADFGLDSLFSAIEPIKAINGDELHRRLMAWHLRHAPQPPTREAIQKALGIESNTLAKPYVDAICSLFSQGSGKAEAGWCIHMTYVNGMDKHGWCVLHGEHYGYSWVPDSWTVCPICGAKKPKGGDGA